MAFCCGLAILFHGQNFFIAPVLPIMVALKGVKYGRRSVTLRETARIVAGFLIMAILLAALLFLLNMDYSEGNSDGGGDQRNVPDFSRPSDLCASPPRQGSRRISTGPSNSRRRFPAASKTAICCHPSAEVGFTALAAMPFATVICRPSPYSQTDDASTSLQWLCQMVCMV